MVDGAEEGEAPAELKVVSRLGDLTGRDWRAVPGVGMWSVHCGERIVGRLGDDGGRSGSEDAEGVGGEGIDSLVESSS